MPVTVTRRGPVHGNGAWTPAECVEPSDWATIAWEALVTHHVSLSAKARKDPNVTLLQKLREHTELRFDGKPCTYQEQYVWEVFPLLIGKGAVDVPDAHYLQFAWVSGCEEDGGEASTDRNFAVKSGSKTCEIYSTVEASVQVVSARFLGNPVTSGHKADSQHDQAIAVKSTTVISTKQGSVVQYESGNVQSNDQRVADERFQKDWDIRDITGESKTEYTYEALVSHCKRAKYTKCSGMSANPIHNTQLPFDDAGEPWVTPRALQLVFNSHLLSVSTRDPSGRVLPARGR